MYEFPRGNEKITGPSIRLAEAIAQNWGNIDFGFMELEQRNGASQVMAYAWDLETNSRQTKLFTPLAFITFLLSTLIFEFSVISYFLPDI